tara:strand:+ start:23817 stop:24098 length:282 start_codon:yes stop_codon:yes gene_type:complete
MMGLIYHKGLVKRWRSTKDGTFHIFPMRVDFHNEPFTVIWHDEEGINYVASINVRVELDGDYANPQDLPIEKIERENIISESLGEEDKEEGLI